jgi:hypothetical protein
LKKIIVLGLITVILLLGIAGCSSGTEKNPMTTIASATTRYDNTSYYSSEGLSGRGDSYSESTPEYDVIVNQSPAPMTTTTTTIEKWAADGSSNDIQRMVIKNASVALVVEDVTSALQQITTMATVNGGYVINSNIREDQNRLYADISFRVTADKFDQTLQSLHGIAVDVRSETTSGQDVTEEYVDLEAQLHNLEASETQLLALMDKAGTVEEILKVQQQLTATRGQIEQIKGRMQYLEQSAALSVIYASLEQSKLSVEFYATAITVKEDQKIQFVPTIGGGFAPYSFEWNFGDGKTSTEGAPFHVYDKAGTYSISLTVKDDKGNTADYERKDYVTVLTGWAAGNTASTAWNGLVAFGRFLGSLFIWLGIFSPVWIAILVILYFTWWRRRKKMTK